MTLGFTRGDRFAAIKCHRCIRTCSFHCQLQGGSRGERCIIYNFPVDERRRAVVSGGGGSGSSRDTGAAAAVAAAASARAPI